jgi:hypothetical protein
VTGLSKAIEPRPFASLSSGLLARKGQAKPAMRPQGFGGFGNMTMGHEDLGWNDMGYDTPAPSPAPVEQPSEQRMVPAERFSGAVPPPPPVLEQRQTLAEQFDEDGESEAEEPTTGSLLSVKPRARAAAVEAAAPTPEPAAVDPVDVRPAIVEAEQPAGPAVTAEVAPAAATGRKAAFTLRLDQQRHLKLRLACAVDNRSAQQIVTAALDAYLNAIDALDDLAGRVPGRSTS